MFNWIKKFCARISAACKSFFNPKKQEPNTAFKKECIPEVKTSSPVQTPKYYYEPRQDYTPSYQQRRYATYTTGTTNEYFSLCFGRSREHTRPGNGNRCAMM